MESIDLSHQRAYNFDDFKVACGQRPPQVFVSTGAQKDASDYFKLNTQQAVRDFIFNGGLEDLKFRHSDIWRNNPDPNVKIMEDEYSFRTGSKYGYLAFFQDPKKGKWIIKSFKINWNSPLPSSFIFKRSGSPSLIIEPEEGK
jgi:hypothetical protein